MIVVSVAVGSFQGDGLGVLEGLDEAEHIGKTVVDGEYFTGDPLQWRLFSEVMVATLLLPVHGSDVCMILVPEVCVEDALVEGVG